MAPPTTVPNSYGRALKSGFRLGAYGISAGVWLIATGCGVAPVAPMMAPSAAQSAPAPTAAPPVTSATADVSVEPSPPMQEPLPQPERLVLPEAIYRWGDASPALDVAAFNQGEMGPLTGALPPGPTHPHPRVIIDVVSAQGARTLKATEAGMRSRLWQKTIACYRPAAFEDPTATVDATIRARVAASGSISARSKDNDPVARCLADAMDNVSLGPAKGATSAQVRVRVWPGDEPLVPPDDMLVPGTGKLQDDTSLLDDTVTLAQRCYDDTAAYAPFLRGRLAIRVHVTATGAIDEAFEVETQFPDEAVRRCVTTGLRKLSVAAPLDGDARYVVAMRMLPEAQRVSR